MPLRIITEGESVTVDVPKGTEVYDPPTGTLFERWTGTEDEVKEAFAAAGRAEKARAHAAKESAAQAARSAAAEAKRTASANA